MSALQIYDPRERRVVAAVDALFAATAGLERLFRARRRPPGELRRILLMRIERIGDLVMTLEAIRDVRAVAADAEIDLVVGSWNASLARAIPSVSRVLTMDAGWLSREAGAQSFASLVGTARSWRAQRYDLVINFEPDLRSNYLVAASRAQWTVGYRSGGGGPLLDVAVDYDQRAHTAANAKRLVATAFGRVPDPATVHSIQLLTIPPQARARARDMLRHANGPLVGIHPSGGRAIKQWDPLRFAAVARRLIDERQATIVLTGGEPDRPLVDIVKQQLPAAQVVDAAAERDLLTVGAVLERLDVVITGDTGPMHLAAAVGTPIVAVFGPSDPARYAPRGPLDRVVRIDLPCAPCNRIRLPPARCVGHVPDCLAGISADRVFESAAAVLDRLVTTHDRRA